MVQKPFLIILGMLLLPLLGTAQAASSDGTSSAFVFIAVFVLLLIAIIFLVGDRLLKYIASQNGAKNVSSYSVIPTMNDFVFGNDPVSNYVPEDASVNHLKQGMDLKLNGSVISKEVKTVSARTFAVKPKDFVVMSPIPKVTVEVGQHVKAGDILFFDKKRPAIQYAAPVSGVVKEVKRAEKRSIAEVIIEADAEMQSRDYDLSSVNMDDADSLVAFLLDAGLWPLLRQRPFDMVPNPDEKPTNIFVSSFDKSPYAPNANLLVNGEEAAFQKGLDVLAKLTDGKVFLSMDAAAEETPSDAFLNATNVEHHWFTGAHPAGNVGVQMHHISPVDPGTSNWYIDIQSLLVIGRLFVSGKYDTSRIIAVAGNALLEPYYAKTYQGASIAEFMPKLDQENINNVANATEGNAPVRVISGDVLTGNQVGKEGYIGFFDNRITVIPEGDYYEPFGWLVPQKSRPSLSNTFPGTLVGLDQYEVDTNTHGEKRAFVVTGQYEKVLPMDIYPQHLMKAILANDIEKMEGLGILELGEEDIALCEYVCTSKQPLQSILREGLETLRMQSM